MKRVILLAVALFLSGCSYGQVNFSTPVANPQKSITALNIFSTPNPTPTPTATIGYQATAMAAEATAARAQQEADAAARLMVQSTAEYEMRLMEQIKLTAQVDRWTATAALTSVPLTSTAQANMNTAAARDQSILSAQITQTFEAPTKVVEMNRAQVEGKMIPIEILGRLFALGAMGYFMIAIGYFAIHQTTKTTDTQQEPVIDQPQTVTITLRKERDGSVKWNRLEVPCSPDALSELAIGILNEGKTLGINSWEGKQCPHWNRKSFRAMRNFLLANKFAVSDGSGTAILIDDGKAFLRGWLDNGALPHSFEFGAQDDSPAQETAHDHEDHAAAHAVGGAILGGT